MFWGLFIPNKDHNKTLKINPRLEGSEFRIYSHLAILAAHGMQCNIKILYQQVLYFDFLWRGGILKCGWG